VKKAELKKQVVKSNQNRAQIGAAFTKLRNVERELGTTGEAPRLIRKGGKGDDSLLVEGYSGDSCRFDRASRGSIVLKTPRITAPWLVQPDKFLELFTKDFAITGGLLPRFLLCRVNVRPQPIDPGKQQVDGAGQEAWKELVVALLEAYGFAAAERIQEVTKRTNAVFDDYCNDLIAQRDGELSNIDEFAARWAEQAWRIGIALHVVRHGLKGHKHSLSPEIAHAAVRITKWFAAQQLEVLESIWREEYLKRRKAVLDLIEQTESDQLIPHLVQRKGIVATAREAKALLDHMVADGDLGCAVQRPQHGAPPSCQYKLPA
jgi:hypothetical protein